MLRLYFSLGAVLAGLSVMAGAYGAHGAETTLGPDQARWINKAARYQMYHSFALIVVAWAMTQWPRADSLLRLSGGLFLFGMICFCGSLYIMAFSPLRLGYMTPLGGISFMAGWALLAFACWK